MKPFCFYFKWRGEGETLLRLVERPDSDLLQDYHVSDMPNVKQELMELLFVKFQETGFIHPPIWSGLAGGGLGLQDAVITRTEQSL